MCLSMFISLYGCHKAPEIPQTPPVATPPVVPAGKFDLKGFYLGMPEEEATKVVKMFCADDTGSSPEQSCYQNRACLIKGLTLAGKKTNTTTLVFKDNELTAFKVEFPTEHFMQIAVAFTSQYGEAKTAKKKTLQNSFGASFDKVKLSWSVKDALVSVANIDEKVTEGVIEVQPSQLSEKIKACWLKAQREARQDL